MARAVRTNVLRFLDAERIPYETVTYDVEDGRYLVSQKATTQNLSISFSGVAYDQATGVITITGLRVFRGDSVKPIAERATLAIKTSNINS